MAHLSPFGTAVAAAWWTAAGRVAPSGRGASEAEEVFKVLRRLSPPPAEEGADLGEQATLLVRVPAPAE